MSTDPVVAPLVAPEEKKPAESMAAEPMTTAPVAAEPPKAEAKVEEPVAPVVEAPVVEAPPVVPEPTAASQDETKPEKAVHKGGILNRIFSTLKGDKKPKVPKSPKKDAKKEMKKEEAEVMPEAPLAAATEPAANAEMPKQAEVTEPPQATENPVAAVAKEGEEPKEMAAPAVPEEMAVPAAPKESAPKTTSKLARRLSHTVVDIFRGKPKADVPVSPKVDELPPMIEQPPSVAPLENPATAATASVVEAKVQKPVDAAAPAVTATA